MTIPLPARLDTPAARPLARLLQERIGAGGALLLDATAVDQIGQACLQVLVSARATALAGGLDFMIERPSQAFLEGCSITGLNDLTHSV